MVSPGGVIVIDAPLHGQGHYLLHSGLVYHRIIPVYHGQAHAAQPQVGKLQTLKIFVDHKISPLSDFLCGPIGNIQTIHPPSNRVFTGSAAKALDSTDLHWCRDLPE